MCGINGFRGVNRELLEQMNQKTSHRGPDYSGVFVDSLVSLGHNLLSIREASDLSRQPYSKPNSNWILLFNGQLYNTKDLKKELGTAYQNVDLDTELLFALIEKRGWDFTSTIQGMFAIALYNKDEGVIRLYRDQSGQKGLYYYHHRNQFIFSSELKSILLHHIDKTVDAEALSLSMGFGYIPGAKTLLAYVAKLKPGEVISYHIKENKLEHAFFHNDAKGYYKDSRDVFGDLVAEHLQSKQKVALNLSGGLDSSLLLHEMSKVGHEMITYTNHFKDCDDRFNTDALLARRLAKDYGTTHHEIEITKQSFFDNFIESYELIEEPNFNITLPAYLQTAKVEGIHGDRNRVILSGDGGDEIFAGYPHHLESARIASQIRLMTPWLFNLIKNHRNHTNYNFANAADRWMFMRKFAYSANLTENGAADANYIRELVQEFGEQFGVKKGAIYETMLADRAVWMAGENFIRSDKLYMSQSLEMRSPLAFHPFRVYFDNLLQESDYTSPDSNKLYLRKYYTGKLPDYITKRPDKSGWRSPIKEWYDDSYKKLFLEIISDVEKNREHIDWKKVKEKIERSSAWPGKYVHLYLSLAILSKNLKITL